MEKADRYGADLYTSQKFPEGPANSSTLTKVNFVEVLTSRTGMNRADAASVVESIFDEIRQALIGGRDVKLANFGTFSTRDKVARPGRNPRTGKEHEICARRVVTFIPAPHLRQAVAGFVEPAGSEPAAAEEEKD